MSYTSRDIVRARQEDMNQLRRKAALPGGAGRPKRGTPKGVGAGDETMAINDLTIGTPKAKPSEEGT